MESSIRAPWYVGDAMCGSCCVGGSYAVWEMRRAGITEVVVCGSWFLGIRRVVVYGSCDVREPRGVCGLDFDHASKIPSFDCICFFIVDFGILIQPHC